MVVSAETPGPEHAARVRVVLDDDHVVELDLELPGGSGPRAIPGLRAAAPETPVVAVTMPEDPAAARVEAQDGAPGYVLTETANAQLVEAIRVALDGCTYLPSPPGDRRPTTSEGTDPADDLSSREVEVLRLIALGHTNPAIAKTLFLSVRTVEAHRARLQQKLGRATRADLVDYALQHELIGK